MDFTINSDISLGSIENLLSSVFSFFFNLKCFSIIFAPRLTAAKAAMLSFVWSEYPIGQSNVFFRYEINFKLQFFLLAGYSVIQCKIEYLALFFRKKFSNSFISFKESVPVETIIGFFFLFIFFIYGKCIFFSDVIFF